MLEALAASAALSTVVINAGTSHGAGVVVAVGNGTATIITARHVACGDDLEVMGRGATEKYEILSVTFTRFANDGIATIVVRANDLQPVAVASHPTALNELVLVLGHPGRAAYVPALATTAYRYAMDAPQREQRGLLVLNCATCDYGDSGGGVFNIAGELVSIVSSVQVIGGVAQPYFLTVPVSAAAGLELAARK